MRSLYVLPTGTDAVNPPAAAVSRVAALGCSLIIGDPSGQVTVYPSVVVTSSAIAPAVIPDDTGQATLAQVQAAQRAATTAEDAAANALVTARQGLSTLLAQRATFQAQLANDAAYVASLQPGATLDATTIAILGRILTMGLAATMQTHIDHLTVSGITS